MRKSRISCLNVQFVIKNVLVAVRKRPLNVTGKKNWIKDRYCIVSLKANMRREFPDVNHVTAIYV